MIFPSEASLMWLVLVLLWLTKDEYCVEEVFIFGDRKAEKLVLSASVFKVVEWAALALGVFSSFKPPGVSFGLSSKFSVSDECMVVSGRCFVCVCGGEGYNWG
ncbi:hypothetical protein WICPIJ_000427 [Wickerhamomyces pijperi]|uniref:Secreted protein n=1 Tax=Wickerhamomyces pijperi TaxID=599730 RepID=A0A9P8QCT7_WICPI|nr:hypothetical protein WICPIJ_000427 [Wickerhamomyces pijperi]